MNGNFGVWNQHPSRWTVLGPCCRCSLGKPQASRASVQPRQAPGFPRLDPPARAPPASRPEPVGSPGLEEANAALRAERDALAEAHARIAFDAAELQVRAGLGAGGIQRT